MSTTTNGIGYVQYPDGWHRTCEACARADHLDITDVEHDPDECSAGCHICGHFLHLDTRPEAPYPWCMHTDQCITAGRCTRAINCGD